MHSEAIFTPCITSLGRRRLRIGALGRSVKITNRRRALRRPVSTHVLTMGAPMADLLQPPDLTQFRAFTAGDEHALVTIYRTHYDALLDQARDALGPEL